MGAGALSAVLKETSPEDISLCLSALSAEERKKLSEILASADLGAPSMANFPGMTEALNGIRVYDITVTPAPGSKINIHPELQDEISIKCKFDISAPSRIFIKSEKGFGYKPCRELKEGGELNGFIRFPEPKTLRFLQFIAKVTDEEEMRDLFTLPIDPPFTFEKMELTEADHAKISARKDAEAKQKAEKEAQRREKLAQLNLSPEPLASLLGPALNRSGHSIDTAEALAGKDLVAVYFSAHWCMPCQHFTPKLAKVYDAVKASGETLEIIFATSDRNQEEFETYFATMPWLAMPFGSTEIKALQDRFEVKGIPMLVVLRGDSIIVTFEGHGGIEAHGVEAIQAWRNGTELNLHAADA